MVRKIVRRYEPLLEDMVAETLKHLSFLERRARLIDDFVRVQELQVKQTSIAQHRPVRLTSYELPWGLELPKDAAWLFESGSLTEIK